MLGLTWPTSTVHQAPSSATQPQHVIIISIDGLRPDAVTTLGASGAPNFYRLRAEGSFTDDARSDATYTKTLPNHTTQLTSRLVSGADGHNWTSNTDPAVGVTLHSHKGSYVASAFDVAHDAGMRTGLFVSKSKFSLFETSYNSTNGADGAYGPDKIDTYVYESDTHLLRAAFLQAMQDDPFHLSLLHLRDPDSNGHATGWDLDPASNYMKAVQAADTLIGDVLALVESTPALKGTTAIIVTTDHGGSGTGHTNASVAEHHTIPFYVWGPDVVAGGDLYALNADRRQPESGAGKSAAAPIRNGEAGNLALDLLGLSDIPGSTLNTDAEALQVLASILPVELAAFEARVSGQEATLLWRTASERNNAGFEVEQRAADEGAWRRLGFVEGQGTTVQTQRYQFRVPGLRPGIHRFRLKQTDFDGSSTFSPDVEVHIPSLITSLSAPHPNPFRDRAVFEVQLDETQQVRVTVYDSRGRQVRILHDGLLASDTVHRFTFDGAGLGSGLYAIRAVGARFRAVQSVVLLR